MTKIEECARAVAAEMRNQADMASLAIDCVEVARAALSALLPPSKEMVEAGLMVTPSLSPFAIAHEKQILPAFTAMIQAVLEGK